MKNEQKYDLYEILKEFGTYKKGMIRPVVEGVKNIAYIEHLNDEWAGPSVMSVDDDKLRHIKTIEKSEYDKLAKNNNNYWKFPAEGR